MPHIGVPTEFDVNYDRDRHIPLTDEQRLDLGKKVLEFYIEDSLNFPMDYHPQTAATSWLENIGFDRVEWVQYGDDLLLLLLWRFGHGNRAVDEFILEFTGHDAAIITLFNMAAEWSK